MLLKLLQNRSFVQQSPVRKFRDRHSQRRMARAYGLRRTMQNLPILRQVKAVRAG